MKIAQFIALVVTALALVPGGAHLFALPNKIGLGEADYFVVQGIYRGWALFGIALFGAVAANLALAWIVRAQRVPFLLVAFTVLCLVATLAIFFVATFPTNQATNNSTIPAGWQHLRWRWELSHAINAGITFAGFCALAGSVLTTRD